METNNQNNEEMPVLTLIQQIKAGAINPRTITKEDRQQCVAVLMLEGYPLSHIAQILGRSDKTIGRDLAEIRGKNSLTPSFELAKQLIGELLAKARTHQAHLMRLARSTDGSIGDKVQAEYLAWRVEKEAVEKLQTLGYLPLKPQQVVGDVFHHMDSQQREQSFEEIRKTMAEVASVAEETGTVSPELSQKIEHLNARVEKAEITYQANQLKNHQRENKEEENHE